MKTIILVTKPWRCHDGWASGVNFFTDGKEDHALDLLCRRRFKLWYRSARTKQTAIRRLRKKIQIARGCTVAPVLAQGGPAARRYFHTHACP